MGCHRAEKVMPMLKRWTVLPAIHIMKPIIMRFLNGACATSHAFCSHQESTRGSGSRPRKTLRATPTIRAARWRRERSPDLLGQPL